MSNSSAAASRVYGLISAVAARKQLTPEIIRSELEITHLSNFGEKRLVKTTVQLAKDFRQRGQLGKLRAAVLLGVSLAGDRFLTTLERAGVLLADDQGVEKFGRFLAALRAEIDASGAPEWIKLLKRLPTYEAYARLVVATSGDNRVVRHLSDWPRLIIKKVLAITDLCFLRQHFHFHAVPDLTELFEEIGSADELGNAASFLIAQANGYRPLDSADLGLPVISDLTDKELWALLRHGHAQSQRIEIGKHISLFGYELQGLDSAERKVFYLRPPSTDFEYFLRLGFIRTEVGMAKVPLDVSRHDSVPGLSLLHAAEVFANHFEKDLCEVADAGGPFRRLRLHFPLDPELYSFVTEGAFYDDLADFEMLGQEFLFPVRRASETELMLTDRLDLRTFVRIWRLLHFMSLVDIAALRPYAHSDPALLANSLVRVTPHERLIDLIKSLGIGKGQSEDFFNLVGADVHRLGYFDIQYRPFLRIAATTLPKMNFTSKPEIVHASAIVGASNIIRNVQSANQIRFSSNASIFVEAVANMFKKHFSKVTINRPIQANGQNTDVDVAILDGATLYLFECKHSVPPTGPHELRDIWEEIEIGTHQLRIALTILADLDRLHNYLTGWFPGTKRQNTDKLHIVSCVLCSHRIFSGLCHGGIPIRDYSSLALLAGDGIVRMGVVDPNGESTLVRHRIMQKEGLSSAELTNYLSADSKYFKMFAPFMRPLSRLQRIGQITLASETFAYQVDSDEYIPHLDTIGFTRLPDEHTKVKLPVSIEDLLH